MEDEKDIILNDIQNLTTLSNEIDWIEQKLASTCSKLISSYNLNPSPADRSSVYILTQFVINKLYDLTQNDSYKKLYE